MRKYVFIWIMFLLFALPQQTEAATSFSDVTNATHKEVVRKITVAGIMSGYGDGTFRPNQYVTRGEMAQYIVNAYKLYNIRPYKTFNDVTELHTQYDAIQAVYRTGIMDGSNDNFNPDGILKRAHVAKVFTNLLKLTPQTTTKFKDILTTDANNKYIGALVQRGIIEGYSDGTFKPYVAITRIQMATFLYRSLYGKEPTIATTPTTTSKPTAPKKITSNRALAATKLVAANYRINLPWNSKTIYMKFLTNGNSNIKEDSFDPFVYFFDEIVMICVMNNTDDYLLMEDLRGLEEGKTSYRTMEYYDYDYSLTAYFNQQIRVNNMPFKEAIRITLQDDDGKDDYYFQQGYGLLRVDQDGKTVWELMSYKVR